jgi:5'-nucleotidase
MDKLLRMKKIYTFIILLILPFAFLIAQQKVKLVILHTNDTHSQIEPTAPNALRNPDMGGYARRAGIVNKIRSEEEHVLLLDAGDFSQGTPYYNFFGGRVEVKGYNLMHYDAVTLGNHEFDNGMDSLAMLLNKAQFPVVVSNYQVQGSLIEKKVKPWKVIQKGGVRIGIMGLGVDPVGLVMSANHHGVTYKDPVETARNISEMLKKQKKCDIVICLSHLGSDSTSVNVNDFQIARQTTHIDVIIGGHSHSMLENVKTVNAAGQPVIVAQMGRSGLYLGRIDVLLEQKNNKPAGFFTTFANRIFKKD